MVLSTSVNEEYWAVSHRLSAYMKSLITSVDAEQDIVTFYTIVLLIANICSFIMRC